MASQNDDDCLHGAPTDNGPAVASSAGDWQGKDGGAVGLWPGVTEEHNSAYDIRFLDERL
jgi:hypothetical protein